MSLDGTTFSIVNMAAPSELSIAEIRKFMLENGGKVTNHELVKHFKQFLTNPNTKGEYWLVENRQQLVEIVKKVNVILVLVRIL